MIRRRATLVLLLALPLFVQPAPSTAGLIRPSAPATAVDSHEHVWLHDDRVIIQLTPPAARMTAVRASSVMTRLGVAGIDALALRRGVLRFEPEFPMERRTSSAQPHPLSSYWIAYVAPGSDVERIAAEFEALSDVVRAQPVAVTPVAAMPNDSLFTNAYYLFQPNRRDLHAPEAWDITTGDTTIVVAIIDTGTQTDHPDLSGNIWTNWPERTGVHGVDDDGNGFVDDVHGYDFVSLASGMDVVPGEDWRDPDGDPNDFAGHGTAVAGVVGALANNVSGSAGVTWNVRLMALRIGWSSPQRPLGLVDLTAAAQAVRYATRMGAHVINCSFASSSHFDLDVAVEEAVQAGVIVVWAAGNNGSPFNHASSEDVIAVTASDSRDIVQAFGNRGNYVDITAPGVDLVTTFLEHPGGDSTQNRQPSYVLGATGTSFAAPLVAGAAALVQARQVQLGQPLLSPLLARLRLMESAEDIAGINGIVTGYGAGRLQIARALARRPLSFTFPAGARTVGSGVALPAWSGRTWILYGTDDARLAVFDAASGDTAYVATLPGPAAGSPAAAGMGGGLGTNVFVATVNGFIAGFDAAGIPLNGWPVEATRPAAPLAGSPVLADIDGDERLDVLWSGNDGNVWAWDAAGRRIPGFPRQVALAGQIVQLAAAPLDGAAGAEIIVVDVGGSVHVLDGRGNTVAGWPAAFGSPPLDVVVAELGGRPGPEVIVAGAHELTAFGSDGSLHFSRILDRRITGGIAAGDLDGDGNAEIAVAQEHQLDLRGPTGARFAAGIWPKPTSGLPRNAPRIGHVVPGGPGILLSVLVDTDRFELHGFRPNGNRLPRYPLPGGAGLSTTLVEIDDDGATELLAGSGDEPLIFVYDGGEDTWQNGPQGWPTEGGCDARTRSVGYRPRIEPLDDVAPEPVSALEVHAGTSGDATVRWQVPFDAGPTGRPVRYTVVGATSPITPTTFDAAPRRFTVPAPHADSAFASFTASGFQAHTTWWFAVRGEDGAGNLSAVSGAVSVNVPPAPLPTGLAIAVARAPTPLPVEFVWRAGLDARSPAPEVRVYDVSGRLRRVLTVPEDGDGVSLWDGRDQRGHTVPAGLYFARFTNGRFDARARVVLIP